MGNTLGCDPNFDWRDYARVDAGSFGILKLFYGEQYSQIEDAMDFIASTPEGQMLLKQHKDIYGEKLPVLLSFGDVNSQFDPKMYYLSINFSHLAKVNYKADDETYADFSLVGLMYHELYHSADYEAYVLNKNPAGESALEIEEWQRSRELLTTDATNKFVKKYLPNEALRGDYYDNNYDSADNEYIVPPTEVPYEVMQQCTLDNLDPGAIPAPVPTTQKTK